MCSFLHYTRTNGRGGGAINPREELQFENVSLYLSGPKFEEARNVCVEKKKHSVLAIKIQMDKTLSTVNAGPLVRTNFPQLYNL